MLDLWDYWLNINHIFQHLSQIPPNRVRNLPWRFFFNPHSVWGYPTGTQIPVMIPVTPIKCSWQLLTHTFPFFRNFLHQLSISLAQLSRSSSPCVIALFSWSAEDQEDSSLQHFPRLVGKAAAPHREPTLEHRQWDPEHDHLELSDVDFTAMT